MEKTLLLFYGKLAALYSALEKILLKSLVLLLVIGRCFGKVISESFSSQVYKEKCDYLSFFKIVQTGR